MNIVMTGTKGFIGKIIVPQLEADGHNVIAYDTRINTLTSLTHTPDVFIHAARHHGNITGIITKNKWLKEYETDVIDPYLLALDLKAHYNIKNIIYLSSIYGLEPPKVRHIPANYIAAKAAEIHSAKNLAIVLAPFTRVNIVILGGVLSDRTAAEQSDDFCERYNKRTLLNHMVLPDEIYGAIKFLVSDESKGMTGAEIRIDGGYTV